MLSTAMPINPRGPDEVVRKRFVLALLASMAAHLLLLAGVGLPEFERSDPDAGAPLAARIAPLAPPEEPKPRAAPPSPKRDAVRQSAARRLASPDPSPSVSIPPAEAPAERVAVDEKAPPKAEVAAQSPPAAREAPVVENIPFPDHIYLEFDLAKNAEQAPLARVVHRFERDGARYVIRSVTEATGIAALFATGRYVQESRGTLSAEGLRPDLFTVRRGRAERIERTAFDWVSARATTSAAGSSRDWELRLGAQDQLSILHQMSFLLGAPPSSLMMTNGKRFYNASIEIIGRDTVATGIGPVSALQVRSQLEGELRIDIWLAPERGNLPVKVRFRDRKGEEFEQVLAAVRARE
jgi:hypothetical protein